MADILSNPHLVPIIKGAADPRKGIIMRTYYVRPEELQSMIEKARQIPSKNYLTQIPHYEELDYAVNTNNITQLVDYVQQQKGGKDVWSNIVDRHKAFDTFATNAHYQQRLLQNVYGFVVSMDQTQQKVIGKNTSKAANKKIYYIKSTEKEIKPKLKRTKRVKEQFNIKVIDRPDLLSTKQILNSNELYPDYGKQVKYKIGMYQVNVGQQTGQNLSALLNYVNVNPTKAMTIVSNMISKNTLSDKYNVVKHLTLKGFVYRSQPRFWKGLLVNLIDDTDDLDLKFFQIAMLYKLDSKLANKVAKSDDTVAKYIKLLNQNPKSILTSNDLTERQKVYYVASLNKGEANKLLWSSKPIIKSISQQNRNDFIGALLSNVDSNVAYKFIQKKYPEMLNLNQAIESLYNNDIDYQYHLLQLLASKAFGLHYLPYKEISQTDNHNKIYSHSIATKLFLPIIKSNANELVDFIKSLEQSKSELANQVDVGYHIGDDNIGLDNQVFMKVNPLHTFEIYDPSKHNIKLTVPKSNILHYNKDTNKVVVGDLLNSFK